ncbi:MAG TPA: LytTR family DNA-binding domain-containing protein [Terriglobales bacterium]
MASSASTTRAGERLAVKVDRRIVFLDLEEIDWIEAEGHYVRIHAGSDSYFVRGSIGSLCCSLEDKSFVRIHRSIVVNLDKIKELRARTSHECTAILKNGVKLPCSRTYATLRQLIVSVQMQQARSQNHFFASHSSS